MAAPATSRCQAPSTAVDAPAPAARLLRRRLPATLLALAAAALSALAAWLVFARESAADGRADAVAHTGTRTVPVERRTLVARETVDGTLGYGDERSVASATAGTITRLPEEGSVIRRGEAFFSVNGAPGAVLMYGERPAWRDLSEGVSDGVDVEQLERNLVALGYDPSGAITVDGHFDFATRAAVERWQRAVGLPPTGTVTLGQVTFLPGPRRVGKLEATVGAKVAPGAPVVRTTSTERVVTVKLDADKQTYVAPGNTVQVELPDGTSTTGRVAEVGKVAVSDGEGNSTIDVTVTLTGRAGTGLDQAPVSVSIAKETKRNALVVPVTALLARTGGGYAVEVDRNGVRTLVPVTPGLFADGYVEISGRGIGAGTRVVIPE